MDRLDRWHRKGFSRRPGIAGSGGNLVKPEIGRKRQRLRQCRLMWLIGHQNLARHSHGGKFRRNF